MSSTSTVCCLVSLHASSAAAAVLERVRSNRSNGAEEVDTRSPTTRYYCWALPSRCAVLMNAIQAQEGLHVQASAFQRDRGHSHGDTVTNKLEKAREIRQRWSNLASSKLHDHRRKCRTRHTIIIFCAISSPALCGPRTWLAVKFAEAFFLT